MSNLDTFLAQRDAWDYFDEHCMEPAASDGWATRWLAKFNTMRYLTLAGVGLE